MGTLMWIGLIIVFLLLAALTGGPRINAWWASMHERWRHHER